MATTPNNVSGVSAQTAETFRGPIKGREIEKLTETVELLAKTLKESNIEDRSTLVNDSDILRDAIQQVLSFLESVRVLKVLVNYWNLIFALPGKEMVISRDPENQLQMKVVDSSGQQLFELDLDQCSNPVKQMFGEVSSAPTNAAHGKCLLLTDEIQDLTNESTVSQAMVDELAAEHQKLSAALHRAEAQQKLLREEVSISSSRSKTGEQSELTGTGLSGSEQDADIRRQLASIDADIDRIKLDMADNDELSLDHSIILATQQRDLKKLQREKTVRRRTSQASLHSSSTGGIAPVKVNDAAIGKARILHDTINELTHYFLPKASSSMGRSWDKWCVDKRVDEGGRHDILTFLYFWWDTLNSIWRETDEASKVSRRLRGERLTAYVNPRTLLDSASFINYVSRYQSDVCKYNSIHTARA